MLRTTRSIRGLPALLAALTLAACNGSSSGDPPAASGSLGPSGGSLGVPSGELTGTRLTVPAGALSSDTWFTIDVGLRSNIPGVAHLGAAAEITPAATVFGAPATVTVPFDPRLVPPGATVDQIQMGFRNSVGMVTVIPATVVDLANARVSAQVLGLGTFWPVSPDLVPASSLLPLNDGDTYTFDSGLVLAVARTSTEPNLPPVDIAKLSFVETGRTTAWYFREDAGAVESYGRLEVGIGQEINDSEITVLPAVVQLGARISSVTTYLGYWPFGTSLVAYTGIREETTLVAEKLDVAVPAGVFPGSYRVVFTSDFRDTQPQQGTRTITMWLAPGVGPVRIQFDQGSVTDLTQAVVGGMAVGN